MNCLEVVGVVLSLTYVILASRQNIFCWGAAVASSVVYGVVFYSADLYAEAMLQVFFIATSCSGAYWWTRGKGNGFEGNRVQRRPLRFHLAFITTNAIIGVVLGGLLGKFTNQKLPYADALVTVFSVGTTMLVGKKILENWIYWMVIDSVCILVYLRRGLPVTAFLYTLYVVLAYHGYRTWIKELSRNKLCI